MRSEPVAAARECHKGDRGFTSIYLLQSGTDGKITRSAGNLSLLMKWSDAWVRYLDHIVHFNIYHNATQPQRERKVNLLRYRSVDENKQAPRLCQRQGHREAKKELSNQQKSKREEQVLYISVSDRKGLQKRIDPSLLDYLEWLSTNWAEEFAEEHHQPSSSSSWTPSPTLWSSSSWTPSWQKSIPAQVAGRQMARAMVNETTSTHVLNEVDLGTTEIGATRLKTTSSTLSPSTGKSDCSLVRFYFLC